MNLDTAMRLASAGFAVFPCHAGGAKAKSPMPFLKWREASTTDERQLRTWWARWPDAAIGLDLAKSGLIVIDADRHGANDGVQAFGDLMATQQYEPHDVPMAATPNEGTHFFYRQPSGKQFGNSPGALPAGVDVRGHGGYVIAPGTMMQDGRLYEVFGDIAEAPELPAWLGGILETRREPAPRRQTTPLPSTPAGSELEELLSYIPADCGYHDWVSVLMAIHAATDGSGIDLADQWSARGGAKYPGRKDVEKKWRSFKSTGISGRTLAQIAREHGADLAEIARRYNGDFHYPEVDKVEATAIAARILASAEAHRVRQAEQDDDSDEDLGGAVEQFDLPDTLLRPPGVVGELTDWICEWTSEPIRLHALGAALVIVGTLLGRKVFTETRPCCTALYIGATSPSGMGKQHAQDAVRLALNEVSGAGRLHMGWNVSLPAISIALNENASKVMIADEFADKLIGIRNRNASTSQSAISEGLRSLWGTNTGVYAPDVSISRGDIKIHRPNLSFFGAATHKDFVRSLVSKDVTNGLFNRFLILPRYEAVEAGREPQGIMSLPDRLKECLGWLYNCLHPMQVTLGVRGDGFPSEPILVPFSHEAEAANETNKTHQKAMMRASDNDDALALYGRYAEQIKRVALIVACGRRPERLAGIRIEGADMEFAKSLVDFSVNQFVLTVRREMVENAVEANRALVLGVIRKRKEITRSELLRKVRSINGRDMKDILATLQEAHCIVEETTPTRGRSSVSYRYLRG